MLCLLVCGRLAAVTDTENTSFLIPHLCVYNMRTTTKNLHNIIINDDRYFKLNCTRAHVFRNCYLYLHCRIYIYKVYD